MQGPVCLGRWAGAGFVGSWEEAAELGEDSDPGLELGVSGRSGSKGSDQELFLFPLFIPGVSSHAFPLKTFPEG